MFEYLVVAILAITPGLSRNEAEEHVNAALVVSQESGYDPEFLLAQAWVESRFQRHDFSRIECHHKECHRVTGVWEHDDLPKGARATFYCGALQVGGNITWGRCRELMDDLEENYREGAAHLHDWETSYVNHDPKCRKYKIGTRKRLTCALYGYGGGWKALENKTSTYPARIYRMERLIRAHENRAIKEDQGNV